MRVCAPLEGERACVRASGGGTCVCARLSSAGRNVRKRQAELRGRREASASADLDTSHSGR